ncbi:hypothetical protein ACHAWF_013428 [Thalassiosira exigua]
MRSREFRSRVHRQSALPRGTLRTLSTCRSPRNFRETGEGPASARTGRRPAVVIVSLPARPTRHTGGHRRANDRRTTNVETVEGPSEVQREGDASSPIESSVAPSRATKALNFSQRIFKPLSKIGPLSDNSQLPGLPRRLAFVRDVVCTLASCEPNAAHLQPEM